MWDNYFLREWCNSSCTFLNFCQICIHSKDLEGRVDHIDCLLKRSCDESDDVARYYNFLLRTTHVWSKDCRFYGYILIHWNSILKKDVKLKRYSPGRYIHDYKHTSCLLNFPEITFCVTFRVDMVPWCWNSTYDLDTYRNVEACNLNSEKERGQSKATLRVQNGSLFKE